jgi:hypothetical protein
MQLSSKKADASWCQCLKSGSIHETTHPVLLPVIL